MTYLTCKFLFDHEDMSYYFENITKVVNEIHARALHNIHFKDSWNRHDPVTFNFKTNEGKNPRENTKTRTSCVLLP